jgi:hypothetical protein
LEIVLKKENAYRLCLVCLSIKCMWLWNSITF